jgi:hypothetical protein
MDQTEYVMVNGFQQRSAEAAGTWPRRRRVAGTEEEEEEFFFSPWPKRYGRPGRLLGQAKWAGSVGFGLVSVSFIFSASYSFSIFYFSVLNSNLIFNSVLQIIEV